MKMTALYERISREDRNEGESFSILRQKEYLEAYEKAYHRRLTQKEFVIGLIEQALEEAEEEFEAARADEYEEQTEGCRESTADEDAEPDDIEETDESPEEEIYA